MSLRRTDVRFALPAAPARAVVFGELAGWRDGLVAAGVEVGAPGVPDLAVGPAGEAARVLAAGAELVVLEGRGGARRLRSAGYRTSRFLPLPSVEAPEVLLPLDRSAPVAAALGAWKPAGGWPKATRNRAVAALVRAGAFPDPPGVQAVGSRRPGPPFPLQAAADLGVPSTAPWFVSLGTGDPLTRVVFHVFGAGPDRATHVVKIARAPGYVAPFERDERGLRLVAEAGGVVAAHAPRGLGRFEAAGFPGSVETAAPGERLSTILRRAPRAERLALVERVAAWTVDVMRETAAPPASLQVERDRLRREVLPRWPAAPADLVERVPPVPAVLQHNDLGTWNVVADGAGFTALDWESARRPAFPLWDLVYFLVYALGLVDDAEGHEGRAAYGLALLRGQAALSPVLFRWVRRGVEALGIPAEAVGPLVTLCFLHHGLSHVARHEAAAGAEAGAETVIPAVERIAPAWLADPLLGPTWSAWR